jgi:hypothetical protein
MPDSPHYEILLVPSDTALTESDWTWRRIEDDGSVSSHGLRHTTMKACYAEAHHHKSAFGEAVIRVNLLGESAPRSTDSPSVAPLPLPIASHPTRKRVLRGVAGFG